MVLTAWAQARPALQERLAKAMPKVVAAAKMEMTAKAALLAEPVMPVSQASQVPMAALAQSAA
jgi:hypothetical protein